MIFLTAGAMSFFSPSTIYGIFPLIFGIATLIGYILKKLFVFDTGIFFTIVSYMFASSGISPGVYNLLVIMGFFFLLIAIWFYGRNTLLISGIGEIGGDTSDIGLSKFRISSLSEILNTLLMGILLSILASLIGLYSSLGITLSSVLETLLMVILSAAVFFITFFIIKLLSSEEVQIGSES